ncbi:type I polyketide synthase [Trichormus sp. NMC-1]|uniref:type I polyketide synthase n=1 Tax=Trichormus sp. NMC-1 TaxID=1853259 RepID=UPI0008DC294F|nr:type I polyketide synthase [Trichormus sp. NMC-1]
MNNIENKTQICETDIAIIGMAGRFPKANNLDAYWQNLREGVEALTEFTDTDLQAQGVDAQLLNNPHYVKAGFVLEDVESFAASFFDYSPREAEIMDPQQRIFLEVAWEALENAGYNTETDQEQISIYASSSINTYFLFNLLPNSELIKLVGFDQIRHNNRADNLATRVAYKLNFKGSAINVQTGCSSSLVGIHLACQSLLNHECDIALAGGVSISANQTTGYLYQEGGILSPDGHCRAFDAQAKGTLNGNGVGVVVFKRLQDAMRDGDFIHAIIKGTAVNNDGSLKVGYTAPSIDGQAKVITEALAVSGVNPETISYIETHGTGTVLGDPIEIAALKKSFDLYTQKQNFCALSSVKTNIGHLDAAAGIAGFIKTVLALKNKQIPPSLNFASPNPQIDFANSPFYVNNQLKEWHSPNHPRRAGVSSFGIGGTNAHIILEEAPNIINSGITSEISRQWQLLPLSAKTNSALETATQNLANYFRQNPDVNLADVAYTLSVGRQSFEHRRIAICENIEDAIQVLETQNTPFSQAEHPAIIFMFPGQGSQYVNMGRELYETEAIFREQVDNCCELLKPHLGLDLRQILYPTVTTSEATQQLTQTAITQPALFVIEYALAKLWITWGVNPQAMIGHSIGEYVAACLGDVFTLEDALALVAMRGKLMQQLPSGAMLAVFLSAAEIKPLLNENLSLAANNAPNLCVVSGTHAAIEALHQQLAAKGVECRNLHTSHAFHSQMMNPIIDEFQEYLSKINLQSPQIPFISNVTGTWITTAQATDSYYWGQHLRQTVRFAEGMTELGNKSAQIFLEVGPGKVLSNLVKQLEASPTILSSLRHPQEQQSDVAFLFNTLGKLWQAGIEINWSEFYNSQRRYRVPLPTYPFERQRFWIEPQTKVDLISQDINDWFYVPVWKQTIPLKTSVNKQMIPEKRCCLVFIDGLGIGTKLVQELQQQRQDVIIVQAGDKFTKFRDGVYSIYPQAKADYDALIKDLCLINKTPEIIFHCWGITPNNQSLSEIDFGFWSLLFLAQALGQQPVNDQVQIIVITNNLHNVTGEENLSPEKTTVLGACKVIGQEFTNITCRNIDIIIPQPEIKKQQLIEKILAELISDFQELIIAYRGQHRWIQTFEKTQLETASLENSPLRQGGVYVITGGLGGIGLTLAEYLAQTVKAKLVLIGRSQFPKRNEWEEWLINNDPQNPVSQNIKKLQNLENIGAEVLVLTADVTSLEQMQSVKNQVLAKFGEINGVIHTAGVPGGGIIQLKTPETAQNVLAPKVQGTLVIDTVFCDEKLDLFVLCSSLTSILGGLGQVDYCAANAFLDGFAQSKYFQQKPLTITINWCGWQEVGMLVNTAIPEELKNRRAQHLNKAISPQNGIEAFSRILHSRLSQVVVSKQNIEEQIQRSYANVNLATELNNLEQQVSQIKFSQQLHPRPHLSNPYVAPRSLIEQSITELWQQTLGLEQVGIYDNFFELGGHSLLATQVISQVRKTFLIEIPLSSLFSEGSTIANLAEIVEHLILEKIADLSEEEAQRLLGV